MKSMIILLLITVGMLSQVEAGTVSVRMAEAYNSEKPKVSSQLKDVAPLLKKTLGFNCYTLHNIASMSTPVDKTITMNEYKVKCNGDDKKMQITIFHKGKSILKTTVIFKKGKPVIVGGLSGSKGKIFFIFSACK